MCNEKIINLQTGEVLNWERVNSLKDNAMLKVRPDLWIEWDFEKNDELGLDIWKMTKSSEKRAWWICRKDNSHKWDTQIKGKVRSNCPICSNKKIVIGVNDLATTHPHIIEFLINKEDGHKYTHGSGEKIPFKCVFCDEVLGNKIIKNVVTKGIKCPNCQYVRSLPERIMTSLLNYLDIPFENEKSFDWINDRKYDFYIPTVNSIIEMHGQQHYRNHFKNGRRTSEEEKENDLYKKKCALENNIKHYITIDCEQSDFDYIKNNIVKSELKYLVNLSNINWSDVFKEVMIPTVKQVCNIYNNKDITLVEIAKELNISRYSVIRYLSSASEYGLCDYTPNNERNKNNAIKQRQKSVVQLSLNGEYINEFDSIKNALDSVGGKSASFLSACCRGEYKSAYGFKWMFFEVYENHINNNTKIEHYKNKRLNAVVQMNDNFEIVNKFVSVTEASILTNINRSSIGACCSGKRNYAGGFKWLYLEDYNNYIKQQNSLDKS